ncbi:Winged helix-turn-helix transcription repressor DNA-binding [Penicillium taxi]|uniref:Winged helix-turn-helix transcription repressor DNA-binding n=1 Tax=Penicillium taxi TaxID=168475 RepID=UPI002545BD84|nr:Winged helix-turn-helix transcription repressor DNA-binding [Penicillium taxi]KAJ5888115.1 Winged helix-turn-helix transcription repressor DNA-binding [Penicillium taxi]
MSSQTMTAPALGHRPPDTGQESPIYDYGRSQNVDSLPNDSRTDSAICDMHHSVPASKDLAPSIGIKTEPLDHHTFSTEAEKEISTQSAAGALLAQLLGNPSSNSAPAPANSTDMQIENPEVKLEGPGSQFLGLEGQDTSLDMNPYQDQPSTSGDTHNISNDNLPGASSLPGIDMTNNGAFSSENIFSGGMDVMNVDGLEDPLKSTSDQPSLMPAFDFNALSQDPFEALHQNELLTAAFLAQNSNLSALGYQDSFNSAAGEPRIQAFAKLEFDDGHFYCNTYSFILGRDVRAARAAHQRELQYRQAVRSSRAKSSSGGNVSQTPNRMKREGSAAMIGSVVSDRGGIMGFDPDVPPHLPSNLNISRRSSKSPLDESAMPMHANPAELQTSTDYNALALESLQEGNVTGNGNGEAKPVDALALLPSPDSCPTIPIHPPTTMDGSAAGHRGISRRHVKIAFNFDRNLFEMEVMGRNGAFIGADWLSPGQLRPLHSGDYIQIGGVRIRFLLPEVPIGETGADRMEELAEDEELDDSPDAEHEIDDMDKPLSDSVDSKEPSKKIILKTNFDKPALSADSGENGQPARRRGPGRPPKDGIMSKRERAELAREQKNAAKKDANGGVTPPPAPPLPPSQPQPQQQQQQQPQQLQPQQQQQPQQSQQPQPPAQPNWPKAGKAPKESVGVESPTPKAAESKRKYNKRKKDANGVDFPLPSTEGGAFSTEHRAEEYVKPPPVKKRKPSRSPSPNYPPESAYTQEDLAKPPYNYAVLIFDALTEAGIPMTLKQIYRALKLKYPYFRFKCETEGWTSSVRHNLNGNSHLFMHAERDGKGWSWQLKPGASVEKEKKRRPSPPPPQPVPQSAPQVYMGPMSHSYNPAGIPPIQNQHQHQQQFQFPSSIQTPSFSAAPIAPPQHSSPYPPSIAPSSVPLSAPSAISAPSQAQAPAPVPVPAPTPASFPIPSTIRNNLPAAFARTVPSTYTSPYASNASSQPSQAAPNPSTHIPQIRQSNTPQSGPGPAQHQSPYAPVSSSQQHTTSQPAFPPPVAPSQFQQHQNHQPRQQPAPSQPQHMPPSHHEPQNSSVQHQVHQGHQGHQLHQGHHGPGNSQPQPLSQGQNHNARQSEPSFLERANKAIDDFEAVLVDDYTDKNYIKEVLRSARAQVLGGATESSFPQGAEDEAVIMKVLRDLVENLRDS